MNAKIMPRNKMAQLLHRSKGNPSNTLPNSAISNCFPGLEYDFKNFWRRAFVGIVLLECDNLVAEVEDSEFERLLKHRLLKVDGQDIVVPVTGPRIVDGNSVSLPAESNQAVVSMEWSNSLAFVMQRQGQKVTCHFAEDLEQGQNIQTNDHIQMVEVELVVRTIFVNDSLELSEGVLHAGELTQGLCSPWQHDYRECSCYYWPASRPDYVNVEPGANGNSRGDNWLSKERSGEYILDDRLDSRLVSYDDLFIQWEKMLHFQIKGHDSEES